MWSAAFLRRRRMALDSKRRLVLCPHSSRKSPHTTHSEVVKRGENYSAVVRFHLFQLNASLATTSNTTANPAKNFAPKTHVNTPQLISLTPIIQSFHFHQLQQATPATSSRPSFLPFGVGKFAFCSLDAVCDVDDDDVALILQFPAPSIRVL